MDAGQCVEFGTPYELLTTDEGPKIFQNMVKQTGKATYDNLFKVAEDVSKLFKRKYFIKKVRFNTFCNEEN